MDDTQRKPKGNTITYRKHELTKQRKSSLTGSYAKLNMAKGWGGCGKSGWSEGKAVNLSAWSSPNCILTPSLIHEQFMNGSCETH